jgi:fucose permease
VAVEVAGSLLVMTIVGGAVVTPIMGLVSDTTTIGTAYLVPAGCLATIAHCMRRHDRLRAEALLVEVVPVAG